MNKIDFIKQELHKRGIPLLSSPRYKLDVVKAIDIGYKKAGWTSQGYSKFVKKNFKNKKAGEYIFTLLLRESGLNYCPLCDEVMSMYNFNKGSGLFGKQTYCKDCQRLKEKPYDRLKTANRKARILSCMGKFR